MTDARELSHLSVLYDETINALALEADGIYVDCTLGGGGHARGICQALSPKGILLGIDQDDFALSYAQKHLQEFPCQQYFVKSNFTSLTTVLEDLHLPRVNGILYDLGVSSFQLDDDTRGFSYHRDGPLDMRMDQTTALSAYQVVNDYEFKDLIRIIKIYGEERYASSITKAIIRQRTEKAIETTLELSEIIKKAYPPKMRFKEKHPARKTFQAIRLEVNGELRILEAALLQGIDALKPGGRLAVITFHSLEDRIVKHLFKDQANPCTCPPDFPVCVCEKKARLEILTRKPIIPGEEELRVNNRSRSAKLRVAIKMAP